MDQDLRTLERRVASPIDADRLESLRRRAGDSRPSVMRLELLGALASAFEARRVAALTVAVWLGPHRVLEGFRGQPEAHCREALSHLVRRSGSEPFDVLVEVRERRGRSREEVGCSLVNLRPSLGPAVHLGALVGELVPFAPPESWSDYGQSIRRPFLEEGAREANRLLRFPRNRIRFVANVYGTSDRISALRIGCVSLLARPEASRGR